MTELTVHYCEEVHSPLDNATIQHFNNPTVQQMAKRSAKRLPPNQQKHKSKRKIEPVSPTGVPHFVGDFLYIRGAIVKMEKIQLKYGL